MPHTSNKHKSEKNSNISGKRGLHDTCSLLATTFRKPFYSPRTNTRASLAKKNKLVSIGWHHVPRRNDLQHLECQIRQKTSQIVLIAMFAVVVAVSPDRASPSKTIEEKLKSEVELWGNWVRRAHPCTEMPECTECVGHQKRSHPLPKQSGTNETSDWEAMMACSRSCFPTTRKHTEHNFLQASEFTCSGGAWNRFPLFFSWQKRETFNWQAAECAVPPALLTFLFSVSLATRLVHGHCRQVRSDSPPSSRKETLLVFPQSTYTLAPTL